MLRKKFTVSPVKIDTASASPLSSILIRLLPGIALMCLMVAALSSCGSHAKSDVVEQKPPVVDDCAIWKTDQVTINSTYRMIQQQGDKILIPKLSMTQLIKSLKLPSDEVLVKKQSDLLNMLDRAPASNVAVYDIEFTLPAIQLRDQIALSIQAHIEKCPEQ